MFKKFREFLRDRLDDRGREKLSPVPKEPIIEEFSRPPTLEERINRLMRYEREKMERIKDMSGYESPEEADDFEIEDDPIDLTSPYEDYFMPKEVPNQPLTEDVNLTSPETQSVDGEATTQAQPEASENSTITT